MFKWFRDWKRRRREQKALKAFNQEVQDIFNELTPEYEYEFQTGTFNVRKDSYRGYTIWASATYRHPNNTHLQRSFRTYVDSVSAPLSMDSLKSVQRRWEKCAVSYEFKRELDDMCLGQIYRDLKFKSSDFGQACEQVMREFE